MVVGSGGRGGGSGCVDVRPALVKSLEVAVLGCFSLLFSARCLYGGTCGGRCEPTHLYRGCSAGSVFDVVFTLIL